jgi:aspartyl-tRNA(Asn)/glutamyl-tRNA(Gln) amidotransferase subunit C
MIHRDTVLHVAELAQLSLRDDEVDALTGDLVAIVGYVEQLGDVDTEGVPPLRALPGLAPWRKDEPGPCLTHAEALAAAPRRTDAGFSVPPFLKRK